MEPQPSVSPELDPYEDGLAGLDSQSMLRCVRTYATEGPTVLRTQDGRHLVSFCLNDYLGLRHHPQVLTAASEIAARDGAGSGASMMAGGHRPIHAELESALAKFKGTEACRVTSSGYTAALAAVQALVQMPEGRRRPILFDRLIHACLLDAVRLHGPRRQCHSFRHNDLQDLERQLKKYGNSPSSTAPSHPAPLVIIEGLYSMDGDEPPLAAIVDLCDRYGAYLLIDDAHATGTRGPAGQGSLASAGLSPRDRPIVVMGTLSKALGSQGGFIAGPKALLDWMTNTSRAYLFDTGLAPSCASAALAALGIVQSEPRRVKDLHQKGLQLVSQLRKILSVQDDTHSPRTPTPEAPRPPRFLLPETIVAGPIIPVIVGYVQQAVALGQFLERQGILTATIRPPTVPPGTSRVRIAITTAHQGCHFDGLAAGLSDWVLGRTCP